MSDVEGTKTALGAEELLPLVYDELRQLARAHLAGERPGQTLDTSALVHEVYVRLATSEKSIHFTDKRHFFAVAAQAMRRILVDAARRKKRLKHGGGRQRIELHDGLIISFDGDVIPIDEALFRLAAEDPLAAKVVELHCFAGLGHKQTAEALEITVYLARQKWAYGRAWLRAELRS